jgi:tellurite resistance protein
MAFKRSETAVVATDLNSLTPSEVEKRIIEGVRRYATNQTNWSQADKNTPFLGSITGMGIESSNLVDITMSIERQFLTRRTKRVPLEEDPSRFRLEEGELGPLMILEGQDTYVATPGLAVQMLMDLGHMPRDARYLEDVVSFAYVVVVGEGYRLNESLRKALRKSESGGDQAGREDALANAQTLAEQAKSYAKALADPAAVAQARREAFDRERKEVEGIEAEVAGLTDKLKEFALSDDTAMSAKLRSRQVALKLRLNTARLKLRVAEAVANHRGERSAVENEKVGQIRRLLSETSSEASKLLEGSARSAANP